jgi:twin arginine-targeting protein translocase TatB
MLDFSFPELIVVFVVALVVLGPERLPKVARTVGLFLGRARAMWTQARVELEREASLQELDELRRTGKELEQNIQQAVRVDLNETAPAQAGSGGSPEADTAKLHAQETESSKEPKA